MAPKSVISASIEVVSIRDLHVGDYILWGNQSVLVISIGYVSKKVIVSEPIGELKPVNHYYKIITYVETRPSTICPGCGELIESLTDSYDEFCSTICKDNFDKEMEEDYKIYGM